MLLLCAGGEGFSSGKATSYSPLFLPSILVKNFAEVTRGRAGVCLLGLVRVEFPISVKTPLPFRLPTLRFARAPDGDWFSASEDCGCPPLALDQVLELNDLGVTFLPGIVGPRKPALRSWMRRVCRLAPPPGEGLGDSGSSCHIREPSLATCLDDIIVIVRVSLLV